MLCSFFINAFQDAINTFLNIDLDSIKFVLMPDGKLYLCSVRYVEPVQFSDGEGWFVTVEVHGFVYEDLTDYDSITLFFGNKPDN